MTDFAIETYAQIITELRPLLDQHWAELALYRDDIVLDPDYSVYEAMDRVGAMMVATARKEGALIGYAVYFMRPHPHYRSHRWAVSDIYWLHPEHRRGRTGSGLFLFVERELADRGVSVMHTTLKTAHPAAGRLLESLGHAMVEVGYSKKLG